LWSGQPTADLVKETYDLVAAAYATQSALRPLDYTATTQVDPAAVEAATQYPSASFGNP
jgi:hypothetical protein